MVVGLVALSVFCMVVPGATGCVTRAIAGETCTPARRNRALLIGQTPPGVAIPFVRGRLAPRQFLRATAKLWYAVAFGAIDGPRKSLDFGRVPRAAQDHAHFVRGHVIVRARVRAASTLSSRCAVCCTSSSRRSASRAYTLPRP